METAGGVYLHDFYRQPRIGDFFESIVQQAGITCADPSARPAEALRALRRPGVLLYLEGVEKLDDVRPLLAILDDSTRLLMTTRDPRQAAGMEAFTLDVLHKLPSVKVRVSATPR